MTSQRTCPECQAPLPSDSPGGLCPRCLLQRGLGSDTSSATTGFGPFAPPSVDELRPLFPQLEIIDLLGQGGMGAVYKARQVQLDRLVALKLLPPAVDASFAERFTREARTLAKLNHPGIVTVFDFGQAGSFYYFVMEFVEGVNLRQAQQAHKLAPAEALAIVPKICEALQVAHDAGVVHRDIKPENILLDGKGRVKIADFGLAKLLNRDADQSNLTHTHQAMGTMHYMAPEQWEKPLTVDHRADIYSLGVVFYELLTGELPLGRFPLPSKKVQVDVRLDEIVLRTLEKEPDRRYQHASDVKTDVEGIGVAKATATNDTASASTGQMALLLDETDEARRQFQHLGFLGGAFLSLVGIILLVVASSSSLQWLGGRCLGVAVVMFVIAGQVRQHWEFMYKGHRIIFENGVFTGETLFIDGDIVSRGGFGRRMELAGQISDGAGVGDRIIAWAEAGFQQYRLRLFAEPAAVGAAPSLENSRDSEKRMAGSATSSRLWVVAIVLLIATITTISAPPNVVFDIPLPGKIALAMATLGVALAAALISTRNNRRSARKPELRDQHASDVKTDVEKSSMEAFGGREPHAISPRTRPLGFLLHVVLPFVLLYLVWSAALLALCFKLNRGRVSELEAIGVYGLTAAAAVLFGRWLFRQQPRWLWRVPLTIVAGWVGFAIAGITADNAPGIIWKHAQHAHQQLLIGTWTWTDGRVGTSEFRADGTFEERWRMKINDTTDGAIDPDKPLVEKDFVDAGQYRWPNTGQPFIIVWSPGKAERSLEVVVTEGELTLKEGNGGVHRMKRQK